MKVGGDYNSNAVRLFVQSDVDALREYFKARDAAEKKWKDEHSLAALQKKVNDVIDKRYGTGDVQVSDVKHPTPTNDVPTDIRNNPVGTGATDIRGKR